MKIADLIVLSENKLMALNNEMAGAVQRGDVDEIKRIDALIAETQQTIDTLKAV